MAVKYPIDYQLSPRNIDMGTHWVTLNLHNIGAHDLTGLDINLNSLDAYSISVLGTGSYISLLESGEKRVLPFQLSANNTGSLYLTLDGWQDGEPFHWESPSIPIKVGAEVAELVSLFAITEPYSIIGEKVRCEAKVRSLMESEGLSLEFWADTPSGDFEELGIVETKALKAGEEATYSAEIAPNESGLYTIYAYLYKGARRLGRKVEYVYVEEA